MEILLETERLILRRLTHADVDHIFALDNDPEVMRYLNGGVPTPYEVIQNQILPELISYGEQHPEHGFWAALDKQTQQFLGWFSCRLEDEAPGEVSIGYRLNKAAWDQGYATEGSRAIIQRAFAELDVQCVIATTYEENRASIRVMEKLGMTLRKTFKLTEEDLEQATSHIEGVEVWDGEDVEYAITKSDWLRLQEGS